MRPDFLTGSIDVHIHSGPDVIDRIGTSIDIARGAAQVGMRALVFKDHVFPSWTKAVLTDQAVPDIRVFGGISLNASVGGLNVNVVKGSIAGGCKVIMFPTFDAREYYNKPNMSHLQKAHLHGEPPKYVQTVDEDGKLVPEAVRVLEVVAQHPDVVLSNGHLGPFEILPWLEQAKKLGIRRIMIEHPNGSGGWQDSHYEAMVAHGAYLNISYNVYHGTMGRKDPRDAVRLVRLVGAEHCNLMTDAGQPQAPWPHETYRMFCEMLYYYGLTLDELELMRKVNPARLLGLPETD